jgi:hypothetical protein
MTTTTEHVILRAPNTPWRRAPLPSGPFGTVHDARDQARQLRVIPVMAPSTAHN